MINCNGGPNHKLDINHTWLLSYFVLPTDYGDRCLKHEHRGSGVTGVGPAAHDVPDVVPVHHTVGSDVAHI